MRLPLVDPVQTGRHLIGYSESTAGEVLAFIESRRSLDELTGDWTVIDSRGPDVVAVSSAIAAAPVYYATDPKKVTHTARNVFEAAGSAGLQWMWNERAIRCLALLGHTLGSDTLHPNVYRVPNDAVTTIRHGVAEQRSLRFWDTLAAGGGSCREVVDALLWTVRTHCAGRPVLLSLSAGFDSRVLLALCLASGIRPRCVTMGPADATDVEVAAEICRREGLSHERIELREEDYLSDALDATRLTSGVKLAANWHTYLYAKAAARGSAEVHLVGSNGEFARNYYLHHPLIRSVGFAPALVHPCYWLARLERRRRKFSSLQSLSRGSLFDTWRFSSQFTQTRGRLDEAMARFYATQRVRHFIGAGLALYSAVGTPKAPFLEPRVLRELWRLPRYYWSNERFHREAIGLLWPALLDVPFNMGLRQRAPFRGYSPFGRVLVGKEARERIIESASLDAIFPRAEREAACNASGTEAAELLLTLAFAASVASSSLSSQRSQVAHLSGSVGRDK